MSLCLTYFTTLLVFLLLTMKRLMLAGCPVRLKILCSTIALTHAAADY